VRLRGIGRIQHCLKRVTAFFRSDVVILLYHRVAEPSSDPRLLCVSPRHFAQHLEYLGQRYPILSLQTLVSKLKGGELPKRGVVLTFDDGYADNLWNAKPLMARYDFPATVFVTPGFIKAGREFWWDQLERLLLQPGTLPEPLVLEINGRTHEWELAEAASYTQDDYAKNCGWNVLNKEDPTARHRLYRALCKLVRPLRPSHRENVLEQLAAWAGNDTPGSLENRSLNLDELRELAASGLVEVGAHSMSHSVLSCLPEAEQRSEIAEGKLKLEEALGKRVTSFSYPFGGHADYTADTVRLLKETGYHCACSNFPGLVFRGCDTYQIPRFLARNWDGEEFAKRVRRFFRGYDA